MMRTLTLLILVLISGHVFAQDVSITANRSVKKGMCMVVELNGAYNKEVPYSVYLVHNEQKEFIDELNMQKLIRVSIPRKTRSGKGYQLAIVHDDQIVYSNTFRVKRKVSLALYGLPVAAFATLMIVKHQDDGVGISAPNPPDPPRN